MLYEYTRTDRTAQGVVPDQWPAVLVLRDTIAKNTRVQA